MCGSCNNLTRHIFHHGYLNRAIMCSTTTISTDAMSTATTTTITMGILQQKMHQNLLRSMDCIAPN